MNYSLFLRDSKLWAAQLPEKPNYCSTENFIEQCLLINPCFCSTSKERYELAHAKALSEALEVENYLIVGDFVNNSFVLRYPFRTTEGTGFMKEGDYLTCPGKVEIVDKPTPLMETEEDVKIAEYEAIHELHYPSRVKKMLKLLPLSGTSQPEQKESEHLLCDCELSNMKGHPMMCFMCTGKRHKVPKDLDQKLSDSVDKDLKPEVNSAMSYTNEELSILSKIRAGEMAIENNGTYKDLCDVIKIIEPRYGIVLGRSRFYRLICGADQVEDGWYGNDATSDIPSIGVTHLTKFKSLPSVSEGETQEELWSEAINETLRLDNRTSRIEWLRERFHITRIKK